jgi:phosphopantothenoylcysteine decarboxylase/phosphopantothenate--cysteine ligase
MTSDPTTTPGPLAGRYVLLGVTGSIAAYKGAAVASQLRQAGARVDVLMTPAALNFVTPLTMRAVSGGDVYHDVFDPAAQTAVNHVELAYAADALVIAPASATTIARIANGLAEDMVSLTALATTRPLLLAPAMEGQMFENAATQANLELLRQRGAQVVGPESGRLASGRSGPGRMAEPETVVAAVRMVLGRDADLAGRKVVVSAGGTREALDPVRYVGNRSSGKMGYALAEAARDRGACVVLVSTASLPDPYGVAVRRVESAASMLEAVEEECRTADALIMAAAVADYMPATSAEHKIKKHAEGLTVDLVKTPDILASVRGDFVRVGFAAETQDVLRHAAEKLAKKDLDLIVANDVSAEDAGFAVDTNRVTLLHRDGRREDLPVMPKYDVARAVLDRVATLLDRRLDAGKERRSS